MQSMRLTPGLSCRALPERTRGGRVRGQIVADANGQQNGRNGGVEKRSSQAKGNVAMRILDDVPLDYRRGAGTGRTDRTEASTTSSSAPRNGNGVSYSNGNAGGTTTVSYVAERIEVISTAAPSNGVEKRNGARGIVLARTTVPTMPIVRSVALEAAQAISVRAREGAGSSGVDADRPMIMDSSYRWSKDNYSRTRRNVDIWSFILTLRARLFLLDKPWSYPGGFTEEKKKVRTRRLAIYIRESLLELGPTFIKVGQLFSTRSDLFPSEFTEELSKLQDRVPAFPPEKAMAIVERELGAPVDVAFAYFDRRPIAAASLGQVHVARLHSGEEVVVKVQRPGLRALFDIDLANLKIVAEQLDKGDEARDFKGIYQECATILYKEIDYIAEGRNADRFRRNFRDTDWVRVPTVYWRYTSPVVLTLEYLPGTKISDVARLRAASLDTQLLARRATECYLIQILKHGFLHADCHPGNIAVDSAGRLIFYDFGMMSELVPGTKTLLMDVFYGVYRKDADAVIRALRQLDIIVPTGDAMSLRRAIAFFLDNITRQAERQETVSKIGEDLFTIAIDQPFRFPATFTFVLRSFSALEGIGKALDPNYKFAALAQPYAQELLDIADAGAQRTFVLDQLQREATVIGNATAAMPSRIAHMDSVVTELERGDLKLRVRVLEGERAARRAGILQVATINTVAAAAFLDVGTQLALSGKTLLGGVLLTVSCVFGVFVTLNFRRVQRLDKFEKDLRS